MAYALFSPSRRCLASLPSCWRLCAAGRQFGQASSMEDIQEDYSALKKRIAVMSSRQKIPVDVFVNNELNLSEIKVYGFDYDFTLARYNRNVQQVIYDACIDYLVKEKKYPEEIRKLEADWDFGIRGLHLDITNGLLLKIDCFRYIQESAVYRGRQLLPVEKVKDIYGGFHVADKDMNNFYGNSRSVRPRFRHLNDLFSLSEVALIVNVMEYFKDLKFCDPSCIVADINDAIKQAHSRGVFHSQVMNDIGRFVDRDDGVRKLLQRLSNAGKELVVITNSSFNFINEGMSYFVGEDWRSFFRVVIVDARKPQFHTQEWKPFRAWDVSAGSPLWKRVESLEPNHVYQEGNMKELLKMTGWKESEILYFGDDVYGDLADPSLHAGIRTGCIVPELEHEVEVSNSEEFVRTVKFLNGLNQLLERLQMHHSNDGAGQALLKEWLLERDEIRDKLKSSFNPRFGSLFRTHQNHSYLFNRLARFSDLYTSDLRNLMHYTTDHVFYPRRAALPHEAQQRLPLPPFME
ncbi:5'-nucleotidase domain-containing protein 3-like [Sycon ciliatum]|uniref:5'-nucleotidase domain-containing protein 3-like n=1 Tax=Sycon ciliatum TaxID=27933 RepID=UPI0020AA2834|eukprot:scpid34769/ scgid8624/ 5&apos; GRP94-neighboring nucleotidase